jgi:phage portal protein BeeE
MSTTYTIDKGTTMLLEEVLNIAQRTVEAQYDDATADSMQIILAEVAHVFGIVSHDVDRDTGEITPTKNTRPFECIPGGLED